MVVAAVQVLRMAVTSTVAAGSKWFMVTTGTNRAEKPHCI